MTDRYLWTCHRITGNWRRNITQAKTKHISSQTVRSDGQAWLRYELHGGHCEHSSDVMLISIFNKVLTSIKLKKIKYCISAQIGNKLTCALSETLC